MQRGTRSIKAMIILVLLSGPLASLASAQSSISATIDRLISARCQQDGVQPAGLCDDASFVRRVHLDVIGRIPTDDERTAFLEATSDDKRVALIDQLLSSPEHARHMADVVDGMLLGRKGEKTETRRARHGWHDYLRESFRDNRPWDAMMRDMILARATPDTDVRAGWFLYEQRDRHQEIAESVARNFLGVRIECAQCHDHPLAFEIWQEHYWGLVSFFKRSENVDTDAGPRVSEKASGGFLKYTDLSGDSYESMLTFLEAPTVPEQRPDEEREETDDDYLPAQDGEPRVPKFSRREKLVDEILVGHPLAARAFVNRMWALLMGRGIIHPFDRMDSTHEASHPELLDALSDYFRDSGYDTRSLLRCLLMTRCYQQDSRPADSRAQADQFAHAMARPLPAESLLRSAYVMLTGKVVEPDAALMQQFKSTFPDILPDEPTARLSQALLMTNHPELNQLIAGADGDETLAMMLRISDPAERVALAFRRAYGRDPSEDELNASVEFLRTDADRETAQSQATQLIWALLASAEFRLNH